MTFKARAVTTALLFLSAITAFTVLYLQAEPQRPSQARRRIQEPVNERRTVRLRQTTHPRIRQARDQGRVAEDLPMDRVILTLNADPDRQTELEKFLAEQQDPASPHFHEWLTPEQFGERFGASADDIDTVVRWLQSHGMQVTEISKGRRDLEFSGTARQIEETLHTEIHNYDLNGESHIANATDISIPEALEAVVSGVVSLHNFRLRSKSHRQEISQNYNCCGGRHYMVPYDFATIYDVLPLWNEGLDGTGQSIAVVGRSNIKLEDVDTFRAQNGLPPKILDVILNGADPGSDNQDEEGEADLDVEWSGAVAKGATIKFVVSKSTNSTDGSLLSERYIVANKVAPILTSSFGFCEVDSAPLSQYFATVLWPQAASFGISVIVASGDSGVASCDDPSGAKGPASRGISVDGEASTPFNLAVGGTQFNENGSDSTYWNPANLQNRSSAKTYIPEVAWDETTTRELWSSGGGFSTNAWNATPSWQTGLGVPPVDPGTTDQHHRYIPDVSLTAAGHDAYVTIQRSSLMFFSGTSASAPAFAGIMAIINQATNQANGNPNPRLYALAAQVPAAFHDVTVGTNSVPCTAGTKNCNDGTLAGYSAQPGYDLVTGWGSVDAYRFVHAWAGTSTTPPGGTNGNGGSNPTPPPPVSGGSGNGSLTAATYHVFPQFADGRMSDGTYYRSTLMISNTGSTNATCTLQLRGLTVAGFSSSYPVPANSWAIASTAGTQNFQSGYGALQCTAKVDAQLLYSYYSSNGMKLSEATVFSSPGASTVWVTANQSEGAQLGLAIANDSDQSVSYTISVSGVSGSANLTLSPRTSVAKFVNQLIPAIPSTGFGVVQVDSNTSGGTASVVGLRFTGNVFTTIPANVAASVSTTANTHHTFPQFADGKFTDGTSYRTTRIYMNLSTATTDCTTSLQGATTDGKNQFSVSAFPPGGFVVSPTSGTQPFQAGYVTMDCPSAPIDAQELYSYYAANGAKLSEATVFSSPAAKTVQILADTREGAQIGLAIANDSDQANSYTITVSDANGAVVGSAPLSLNPRTAIAKFLNDFVQVPGNFVGRVTVSSTTTAGTGSIVGLRYTGSVFTTIPEVIVQ